VANHLRKALKLTPVEINLLRETAGASLPLEPNKLARRVKQVRLTLTGAAPIERAISTAGGVDLAAVDAHLMLRARPGVFVAGEMLDWEAPTGGYLLQATLASGVAAAKGALARLNAD
jgi:predicted flavoprotein YhiN